MASEIRVTNIKANDGTASLTVADSTGAVTTGQNLAVGGTLTSTGVVTFNSDFVPATPLSHRSRYSDTMKILVAAAGATTVLALGGIIATWSIVYSSDISSVDDPVTGCCLTLNLK